MRKGQKFLTCPDCRKRGVYFALRTRQEDNYSCRYCPWYAFTLSNAQVDVENLKRLKEINPEHEF